MENKIIAVTGATGQQGGAVARRLLKDGWKVRALTRDINKPAAPTPGSGRRSEEEMAAMFNFFNNKGYDADIPALRKIHPGLLTLEQYLRRNGWENAQPVPIPENAGWGR